MSGVKRRSGWRPRFSLWAMLVLVTVVAVPLGYVAQRRASNLRRKAAWERLVEKRFEFDELWPVSNLQIGVNDPFGPPSPPGWTLRGFWNDICHEHSAPKIKKFYSFTSYHHGLISTDADLAPLASFREVEGVSIGASDGLTDRGLDVLKGMRELRYLSLDNCPGVRGEFFRHLATSPELESLTLQNLEHLEGRQVCQLSDFRKLEELRIEWCPLLSDETLRQIDLPPSVKKLTLHSEAKVDETLVRWLSRVQLEHLSLRAPVSRKAAKALASQRHLERLEILDAPWIDADLSFLAQCPNLQFLRLEVMPIHGEFLKHLPAPEFLEELTLNSTLLNDENLAAIARCKNLQSLELEWTPLTGEGFEGKLRWPSTTLSLMGTHFSEKGKSALASIRGPSHVVLPANWEEKDVHYFSSVQRPFWASSPKSESQVIGSPYPWNSPLWAGPPKHCSEAELEPVLRLHAWFNAKMKQQIVPNAEP